MDFLGAGTGKAAYPAVYNLNYHIVWCPRQRKPILRDKIKDFLEEQIQTISETKGYKVLGLDIMPDHIHLFISASPKESPLAIVKIIKGVSGLRLFKKYPELKKEYWGGHIWSAGHYIGTAGEVTKETIKDYLSRSGHLPSPSSPSSSSTQEITSEDIRKYMEQH